MPDGATISFDLVSPVYFGDDTDIIPGSYSFPFNIPLDDHNRRVLNFPERLDNDDTLLKDEPAELWNDGRLLFPGLATVKATTSTTAKMYLIVNPLAQLKDKKLNEFELQSVDVGESNDDVIAHMNDTALNPEDHNYIFFPVWNPIFFEGLEDDPDYSMTKFINFYLQSEESFEFQVDFNNAWVPFVKLNYLLESAIESISYSFENLWQTTTELNRLVLYNNYSIIGEVHLNTTIDLNNHVNPDTDFTELFKKICRLFCLAPFTNFFSKTIRLIPLRDLLSKSPKYNWTSKAAYDYEKSESVNYPVIFSYSDMLSTAASDTYRGNQTDYDYRVQDLISWTPPAPVQRAIVYHYPDDALWKYDTDITPSLQFIQSFMPGYDTGIDGEYDYESALQTMIITTMTPNANTSTWLVPQLGEAGSYLEVINPYQDRLIFYRGMQYFRNGIQQYPMASNNIYGASSTSEEISGFEYSLLWDDDQGLYNQWWKDWLEMLQDKRDVTIKLNLSETDIINFNFDEKIRIGNQNFFVKKLSVTLTQNGFKPVTAELVSTK